MVGIVVDLGASACLVILNGFGDSARDVIELIAIQIDPIMSLRPIIRTEKFGNVIVKISKGGGVVFEDVVVV